jgi:hypothetical protein
MSLKKCLGLVSVATLTVGSIWGMGCSSTITAPPASGDDGSTDSPIIIIDSGNHDVISFDTGPQPDGTGGSCTPGDVTAFKPTFYAPAGPYSGACSTAQLAALDAACINTATSSTANCSAWQMDAANKSCNGCFIGQETVTTNQAPILAVANPGEANFNNVGGCIYIADPNNATQQACGKAVQAQFQCELAACLGTTYGGVGSGCNLTAPSATMADLNALDNCLMAADAAGCATYVTAATNCENNLVDGGTGQLQVCLDGFTMTATDTQFLAVINLFCGTNSDGGTDAGGQ